MQAVGTEVETYNAAHLLMMDFASFLVIAVLPGEYDLNLSI